MSAVPLRVTVVSTVRTCVKKLNIDKISKVNKAFQKELYSTFSYLISCTEDMYMVYVCISIYRIDFL